jgi:RNA polymerase sigma-70 factor (ECF subfamily)
MPPMPTWYQGRDAIASFLRRAPLAPGSRWRVVATSASAQPAFGLYRWSDEEGAFVAHDIIVLTLDGARITELIAFLERDAFERFDLPAEWSAA